MKVYMNRKFRVGPWGGGNQFVRAFHELAEKTPGVEDLLDETMSINPDAMLIVGLERESATEIGIEQAIMYKMYVKSDCKLILRVNENDARKGTGTVDAMWKKVSAHVDGTVFVSNWIRDYFLAKGWDCQNNTVIHNGVLKNVFKPYPKFNDGKLHIVAHHWSDNWLKGFDIYERLDELVAANPDKYEFTYVGRHKSSNFTHTKVIRPLSGMALGEELGKHDVYVSASRFDPGPNHVLEALACGLPTYVHKDGGGCVEFAGIDHAFYDWAHLEALLTQGQRCCNANSFVPPTWETCIAEYNAFCEATCQGSTSGSQSS